MLRPTSALPRATDAGGDIASGTTEVHASIDAYLGSAERVALLADVVWKVYVALVVALVVAWALSVCFSLYQDHSAPRGHLTALYMAYTHAPPRRGSCARNATTSCA